MKLEEKKKSKVYESYYVRFHQPVPPGVDKEPVSEFKLVGRNQFDKKYVVDSITWTPDGVITKAHGTTNIIPLANVIHCRISQ
jgi:hypothetical protein